MISHQIDKAFSLHDKDGDGKLNKTEMANMIARGKKAKAEKDAREQSGKQRSGKKSWEYFLSLNANTIAVSHIMVSCLF